MTALRLLASDVRLFASETRAGQHDTGLGLLMGAVFVVAVAIGTRHWVWIAK